jgi:transposase
MSSTFPDVPQQAGLTVREAALRYRVGPDKIRAWINRGELKAINTATQLCGRPRWVVPVDALAEFERRRTGGPVAKSPPRRRRKPQQIDYYPD